MSVYLASKTLAAINEALESDQGNKYRSLLKQLFLEAEEPFKQQGDRFRAHLGASQIGIECERKLWYGFHWAKAPKFDGKTLRLFNRGHLEEPRLSALLMMIGCDVWTQDAEGNQFSLSFFGGHYGSAIDGVVKGIPDAPTMPLLQEFKTHGDASFKKLVKDGVKISKWEHFVQMNEYMGTLNLTAALYVACNKNTDDLHMELVEFDRAVYEEYHGRARRVVFEGIPKGVSTSPGYFSCKFCDMQRICQLGDEPEMNCRTCENSVALEDGKWFCRAYAKNLSKVDQLRGCDVWIKSRAFGK